MKILLFGKQEKYIPLMRYLQNRDYEVHFPANMDEDISSYDIVIFPKDDTIGNVVLDTNSILKNMERHTGKFTLHDLEAYYMENFAFEKRLYPSLIQSPELVKEGIISDLIVNQNILESLPRIAVLGYQDVGKKLVFALQSLGQNVRVGVEKQEDKVFLENYGVRCFYLHKEESDNYIKAADIIVNTLSDYQLQNRQLEEMKKGAYVLDNSIYPSQNASYYQSLGLSYKKVYAGLSDFMEELNPPKVLTIQIVPLKNNRQYNSSML